MKHSIEFLCRTLLFLLIVSIGVHCNIIFHDGQNKVMGKEATLLSEVQQAGMPDEILFAVRKPSIDGHWYANFGKYSLAPYTCPFQKHSGGKICIYNVKTKKVRTIFEDTQGNVRDPQIHYDAKKFIFSYLPANEDHFSLYEMNLDGTGLRRLTGKPVEVKNDAKLAKRPGQWDDIEPIYLPDDQIIFCSSRVNRFVQCWLTPVATVHKCDANGQNVRALSCNVEHDNTPWLLSNGQIIYMRWEYIDRYHLGYHHLWTMNPDGTRQMVFYGNQKSGGCFLDAKPVPDSPGLVVGVFSPGHGKKEHYGRIALFDSRLGPDSPEGVTYITKNNEYTDPWPFSDQYFLAVTKTKIIVLDDNGREETVYTLSPQEIKDGYWIGEPRPVTKRVREPVIADTTEPSSDHGTLALVNVYHGRQMKDVVKGSIKELLVYEVLPKPINYSGAMSEVSSGGAFAVERLLGSVPVSEEGSAYFNIPPLRSVFFVALDEKGHCVKRMHSFTSVMPGEKTTCIGCHEDRLEAPSVEEGILLKEMTKREPTELKTVAGVPEIIDFQRDIQPILDRHCLACHNPDREDGDFNISGHWGPLYTLGYQQMSWRQLFGDNRIILPYAQHTKSNFKPYEIGSGSSRLLQLIETHHESVNMPPEEQKMIRFWLDAGAAYSGTYCCNSWGTIGYYDKNVNCRNDANWPETKAMTAVIEKRCDTCHAPTPQERKIGTYKLPAQFYVNYYPFEQFQKNMYLAHTMSEDGGRYNRHLIFDLSWPEQSKIVRAPLAKEAGGLGVCQAKSGKVIFADKNDKDYQTILAAVARGRKFILEECPRFCMSYSSVNNGPDCPQRFFARPEYIHHMIQYGVLPENFDPKTSVDPFELDQKYWKSLWYQPR